MKITPTPSPTNNMSSWDDEINNHALKVAAIRANPGHLDGIVRKFTSPGYAYALACHAGDNWRPPGPI